VGKLAGSILLTVVGTVLVVTGNPLGYALITAGVGGIANSLFVSMPKTETASTAIKTSRPPRVAAYGTMRLYGAYVLYETGSNGAAIDGYAVHDGMMTAPVAFYIGDDKVTHKSGVSYPGGLVNGLADGRYGDDTTRLYWTDGRTPGTTIPVIASDLPGIWTSNHRGDGVCMLYARFASVKSKNFLKRFPTGAAPASIAAQWQKCPDPYATDPCDDSLWTWTENPIRQLMHYILYREAPRPTTSEDDAGYAAAAMAMRVAYYNMKIAPTIAMWRAASDVCNEAVPLKAGGTEARYRSCLSHPLTAKHGEVKGSLLNLCDGWMANRSDGAIAIYAGKYTAPSVSIGPDHIIAYEWEGVGVDDDTAVNEISCTYISAAHDYNSVECDAWRDEDDIAERGALLSDNLDLQTPSWGQVRRLAKRKMARVNAPFRGSVTTNIAGRIARGQRYINLLIEEAGSVFFDGVAEITSVTRNGATGGITFSWVAADPNIDAWNAATEEGEPASLGDRVAGAGLATPLITSALYFGGGTDGSQIAITATGPDRDDLTWFVRWKDETGVVWNQREYSDTDPGASVLLETELVPNGLNIEVQVAYQVGDGRISEWSTSATVATGNIRFDSTTGTFDSTTATFDRI